MLVCNKTGSKGSSQDAGNGNGFGPENDHDMAHASKGLIYVDALAQDSDTSVVHLHRS